MNECENIFEKKELGGELFLINKREKKRVHFLYEVKA
jgi:hypothetical protein